MPHFKSMYDRDYLYAFDLKGKDCTVTIEKVTQGVLSNGKKKSKKPLCYFRESKDKRPMALNATNGKAIAGMYGPNTEDWVGKRITIFPTTTEMAGETVDCIRVRPRIPTQGTQAAELTAAPPVEELEAREPGSDG